MARQLKFTLLLALALTLGLFTPSNSQADATPALRGHMGIFLPLGYYSDRLDSGFILSGRYAFMPLSTSLDLFAEGSLLFTQSKEFSRGNTFIPLGMGTDFTFPLSSRLQMGFSAATGPYFLHTAGENWIINAYLSAGSALHYQLAPHWALGMNLGYHYFIDKNQSITGLSLAGALTYQWTPDAHLSPALKIASVELTEIFASEYQKYYDAPLGFLTLTNTSDKPLTQISLSFYLREFMPSPTTAPKTVPVLYPGQKVTVPLYAYFDKNIKYLDGDTPHSGELTLKYQNSQGRTLSQKQSLKVQIYGKNSLIWDDLNKLGAFVSAHDQPVLDFARQVVSSLPQNAPLPEKLVSSLKLFTAFQFLPLRYVSDPQGNYFFAGKEKPVDYLQYPRETLRKKTGDCDDFALLYSALLESIGIATAFAVLPSHVLLLVEAPPGLHKGTVSYEGKRWLPVELTTFSQGFLASWQKGLELLSLSPETKFKTALEASHHFPPLTFENPEAFPFHPPAAAWQEALQKEIALITSFLDTSRK